MHYQNSRFFQIHAILTKCLVPCMFELTDVYYVNLTLIILSSRCFPFKIFLRSSKLWSIKLTKIMFNHLPTMTSIWLNYINNFWLSRNCIKTCFCMRKHIDIKNDYQFFDALRKLQFINKTQILWIRMKFSFNRNHCFNSSFKSRFQEAFLVKGIYTKKCTTCT